MIRLMHILTDSNIGGAGHTLLALFDPVCGLSKTEFDIVVVLPKDAKMKPRLQELGIACIELPHIAESSFSHRAIKLLQKCMRRWRPDIVHTHASLAGRIAARMYGKCKIVHTRHSVFEPHEWQKILAPFIGLVNNYYSDAIIAVSPAAKDNLIALGTCRRKIRVIYNGMPPAKEFIKTECEELRIKYNIPQDAFVIAQNARLTEVKGHDYVLDAAKLVPEALFLIAGDGERRTHLENRIKNEDIKNVRLLGFVTAIEEILAVMDVQISASFGTEATSLALIEGMSVGKPTIATRYGGNPYVIKDMHDGLLVRTHSASAIALAVRKLHACKYFRLLYGRNARETYNTRFTVPHVVNATRKLYRGILRK